MLNFLTALLQCSIYMSVITLVYAAILPILSKRYSAKWRYMTWLAITVGWVFPFLPQIELSTLPAEITNIPTSPIQSIIDNTMSSMTHVGDIVNTPATIPLWWIFALIWVVGVISIVLYHALRHSRFMRIVRRWGEPVNDLESLEILNNLKLKLGINKPIRLNVCHSATSPMLIGFFRPAILLPPVKVAADELTLILKHELVHVKRHDLWHKALTLIATAIHWFNPIVYFMAKATAVQCEISCDALVLQGADFQQRKQYGETIIGVVRNGVKLQTALSTNFYGGKRGMKNRITSIMDTKKKKGGIVILCVVLIAIIGDGTVFAINNAIIASPKEVTDANTGIGTANLAAKKLNIKEAYNMDNYSEFLKVENDSVRYYYDGHWVRSLYDENNPDAQLISENAKSIIYFNAVEDKDVLGKGTPIYLKTVRNKDTNKIEKLVEMSEDEAWEILNSTDDSVVQMVLNPIE